MATTDTLWSPTSSSHKTEHLVYYSSLGVENIFISTSSVWLIFRCFCGFCVLCCGRLRLDQKQSFTFTTCFNCHNMESIYIVVFATLIFFNYVILRVLFFFRSSTFCVRFPRLLLRFNWGRPCRGCATALQCSDIVVFTLL